ncbi:hypothetical protein BJF90_36080 [Pseudonocardia sp. CNS-004]|nr:hypothetical protein BJF90_36080 [Pseudonocardia sp. CNS-004]
MTDGLLAQARPGTRALAAESPFDPIERAITDLAAGRPVVVVDQEDRENEGDLVFAAELANPQLVGFTVRHSSGVICVSLPAEACERLALPPMHVVNQDHKHTAFTVSVDARTGISTGISAASGPARSARSPIRRPPPATCPAQGTSSRCGPDPAACWSDPGTPRPHWTSSAWPGCARLPCCARSSTTTGRSPGCHSCRRSPRATGWRWCRSRT